MRWLRYLALVVLCVWIGGLIVLGAVVAPEIFSVLSARDPAGGRALAGTLFGAIFRRSAYLSSALAGLGLLWFEAHD